MAASLTSDRMQQAMTEFRKLNTREARAAFADYWIGIWAEDYEYAWPMLYELLDIVKEDELYADPRRVGPGAPGDSAVHGQASSYKDFAAYFEDRVKQPFETWAGLERVYHYAQDYAPDLLTKAFTPAQRAEQLDGKTINAGPGPISQEDRASNQDNIRITDERYGGGTRAEYLTRRIVRDHPDIAARMKAGEFRSVHAAAIEAGIQHRTLTVRIDDPRSVERSLRKHMSPEDLVELIELLTEKKD